MASTADNMEMMTKRRPPSIFAPVQRPQSQNTEFFDWEYNDSDSGSEFEDDSPRGSFESFGKTSATTVSTYDEALTPPSAHKRGFDDVHITRPQSTQGPKGPHLFRTLSQSRQFDSDIALQMSPLLATMKTPVLRVSRNTTSTPATTMKLPRSGDVANWTTEQVGSFLYSAGLEESTVQKFEENHVNGSVLRDLRLEDLKELGISSFGKRHQIWSLLGTLQPDAGSSPIHTPIDEDSTRSKPKRSLSAREVSSRQRLETSSMDEPMTAVETRRRRVKKVGDSILPAESVSIVAIEQLLPKPHRCSKGENCRKWQRQQLLLKQLDKEYGFQISPAKGGHIFLAGDLSSVKSQNTTQPDSPTRASFVDEQSVVGPSVVASSDLLGPGQLPELLLDENSLSKVERRDAQENIRQFLTFQHLSEPNKVPPTPPLETPRLDLTGPVHPTLPFPCSKLKNLPKLTIPSNLESPIDADSNTICDAPILQNRLGTPFSEMDVPIEHKNTPVVERNNSRSVPPNMHLKRPIQRHSALPRNTTKLCTVKENPNVKQIYPGSSYAGWMKKRKTKLLRHEWNEHHYRLKGTQLAMHATSRPEDGRAIDTIDVNDYSVACSSAAGNSKLSAALKKNLKISSKREVSESFVFQLIPAAERAKMKALLKDGKTHHFAVETRDERIEWMREVMLAKAMNQKSEGFEVMINGERV